MYFVILSLLFILCTFLDWLQKNSNADSDLEFREARCKVCDISLRAHHQDLIKHANTERHEQNALKYNKSVQSTLQSKGKQFYFISKVILYIYI